MLAVVSRRVVTVEGERRAAVVVDEGHIVGIEDRPPDGSEVHDHGEMAVLPGLVDTNVNAADPGRTHWGGFSVLTRACLAGGTTTIVDMPYYSVPATVDAAALAAKEAAAQSNTWCHVAFWAGVSAASIATMGSLAAGGVCGFAAPPPGDIDSGPVDYQSLGAAAVEAHRLGMPLLVQPTPPRSAGAGDVDGYRGWLDSWPPEAEAVTVARVGVSAGPAAAALHVLSVSAAAVVDVLPPGSTAETCSHYLTFSSEDEAAGSPRLKCSPPVRDAANRDRLWNALASGKLAMVVSDHRPIPEALKRGGYGPAWSGFASAGLRLPAVWTGATARGIPLTRVADWLAAAPAWLAGLGGRGVIAPGAAADLCIFDPDAEFTAGAGQPEPGSTAGPYRGMKLRGRVCAVYLDGRPVVGAGGIDEVPCGRLLRRG